MYPDICNEIMPAQRQDETAERPVDRDPQKGAVEREMVPQGDQQKEAHRIAS